MDFLKKIFGDKALTFAEFETALKDNKEVKLANLATGQYVDKDKLDTKITELSTANQTIKDLQDAVKKFDGVDVEKLKGDLLALQSKYDTDTAALKKDFALDRALLDAKAKNPKLAKAALDLEKIKLDGDTVLGLEEQLTALKASDPYLFDIEESSNGDDDDDDGDDSNNNSSVRLKSGGSHGRGSPDYDKMSDEDYYKTIFKKKE